MLALWKKSYDNHESESHSVMSDSLLPHGLHSPGNSAGQNTRGGSNSPLQGIFPTQGSNPGLLNCRWILYQLSHQGSPRKWSCSVVSNSLRPVDCSRLSSSIHGILQARILEWVAISFSRASSRPRDQTQVSHIGGRHFNLSQKEKEKGKKNYQKKKRRKVPKKEKTQLAGMVGSV